MENKNTLALVTAALNPAREILRAEYHRQLTARVEKMMTELAADAWDANKRYDYPSGGMSRTSYQLQKARYELMTKYTNGVKASRSMYDPNIRVAKPDNAEKIAALALEMANAALDGYCAKLAGKIDATGIWVGSVSYDGGTNPWGWSFVKVNETEQVWKTKMIVNVSCLGKLFNQWPTRLMK